jgi:hypothetical protein
MERTLLSDFSMLCPSLEFFNRIGRKRPMLHQAHFGIKGGKEPFAAAITKVCYAGQTGLWPVCPHQASSSLRMLKIKVPSFADCQASFLYAE